MPVAAPLPSLLSRVLMGFTLDYDNGRAGDPSIPSLPRWSNVLQHIPQVGIGLSEFAARAGLSRRVARQAVTRVAKSEALVVESVPGSRAKTVRLTDRGCAEQEAGRLEVEAVEREWRSRFDDGSIASLRDGLRTIVSQLEFELAHFPSQYGPADPRTTGGGGQDWRPTARWSGDATLPLSALLSQALVAFTITFEDTNGPIAWCANVLRFAQAREVDVDGLPLEGRLLLRNLIASGVLVERESAPAEASDQLRLTPLGSAIRDRYRPTTEGIERQWRTQYGQGVVGAVRSGLEAMVSEFDDGLPHHPPMNFLLMWR